MSDKVEEDKWWTKVVFKDDTYRISISSELSEAFKTVVVESHPPYSDETHYHIYESNRDGWSSLTIRNWKRPTLAPSLFKLNKPWHSEWISILNEIHQSYMAETAEQELLR